jgi:hypothetical protein
VIDEEWIAPPPEFPIDRVLTAMMRPDRSARRAVQVVLDALTAEGARYSA